MATPVRIEVQIDGGPQTINILSCNIEQSLYNHHSFEIKLSAQALLGDEPDTPDNVVKFIGEIVVITLDRPGDDEFKAVTFKGIITDISLTKGDTDTSAILLKGHSPTVIIDEGAHTAAYMDKSLKQIVSMVTSDMNSEYLKINNNPSYSNVIPYLVQYKETDFDFLSRLAAQYGEWFYYDGNSFFFGKPPSYEKNKIHYRSDISDLNFNLKVIPLNFKFGSKNYVQEEIIEVESGSISLSKSGVRKTVIEKSEKIFTTDALSFGNYPAQTKGELDHFSRSFKTSQASGMVKVAAMSHVPYLHPGRKIQISIENSQASKLKSSDLGEYLIVTVSHFSDGLGNYYNYFEAVPSQVDFPGFLSSVPPMCEPQSAVVMQNNDPDSFGRIKVRFLWQPTGESTPWLRVATLYAGADKGMFFIPEVGEEVIIGFEYNDPSRPYVMGALFNGKEKPMAYDKKNAHKSIKTKSGNTILFDDTAGKEQVKIINKDGTNSIVLTMDNDGEILITSKAKMKFSSKLIELEAEDIKMKASKGINIEAQKDVKLRCQNLEMKADMNAEVKAGADLKLSASANLNLKSQLLKAEATQAAIKGSAQLALEGGAQASLKGAIVMIN